MIVYIVENIGTIAVITMIAVAVGAAIFKMIKDKRKGKSACGCGCANCTHCAMTGYCHEQYEDTGCPQTHVYNNY